MMKGKKSKIIMTIMLAFILSQMIGSTSGSELSRTSTRTIQSQDITYTDGAMWTEGPIRDWITDITLIDGNPSEIEQIEKLLNRPKAHLLPFRIVSASYLDFQVTYRKNTVMMTPLLTYSTCAGNAEDSDIIFNRIHTVTVEDFQGLFILMKTVPFRPGRFFFFGQFRRCTISS